MTTPRDDIAGQTNPIVRRTSSGFEGEPYKAINCLLQVANEDWPYWYQRGMRAGARRNQLAGVAMIIAQRAGKAAAFPYV